MRNSAKSKFDYLDSRNVSRLVSDRADPHRLLAGEIGPAYWEYRRLWDEARSFKTRLSFPLHVDYEMKFRCNLRCPMCLMSLPPERRADYGQAEKQLSPSQVIELVRQGFDAGQRAMGFGGLWEPLLEPELPQIVAEARRAGLVDIMFNTNGLMLTEKVGRALMDSGLTRLMISLDAATEKTYEQMRVGSDFKTVVANIENFLALRRRLGRTLPLVRLSFCRTAVNEHELEDFVERWRPTVDFFSIQAYGRYDSQSPPGFPSEAAGFVPAGRCAQPHKRLLVRHNGDVLPCCDASGASLVMGNIEGQSLSEIWQGRPLADLRRSLAGEAEMKDACTACQSKFSPV